VNRESGQKTFAVLLREHVRDHLDKITVLDRTLVGESFSYSYVEITAVPSFRFTYLLPLFHRKDDLTGIGTEAVVKGIAVASQDRF
jgi:hypothetical protein